MDVHLRHLRYFVTVAEQLHFTRAAEMLFVSQPALSKQIRMLENHLRTSLFVRDKRAVELTPAGRALLPHARAVLVAWANAEDGVAAASTAQQATLVVGFSTGIGRGLLPVVRVRLAERAPAARLRMRQIPWDDATGGLGAPGAERTDAAFVWLPIPKPQSYKWIVVATEAPMVAMPAGHRLSARDVVDFSDLLHEPFLALPRTSGMLRDHWLAVNARGGHPVRIGAEVSSTEETVEALGAGLGVCLVAVGNTALVDRDGVTIRPVAGLPPSHLVFAWRRGDDRPLLAALLAAVADAVAAR